jgi:hypothetical protein
VKKSDIFIAIVLLRAEKQRSERAILKDLSEVLEHLSMELKQWDGNVDPLLGTQIITKIGSTKSDLSLDQIVRDIDILSKRTT